MAVKRAAAKKAPAKKTVAKRAPAKKAIAAPPAGYSRNPRGTLLVPSGKAKGSITPASKLRAGITKAQDEIKESLQEIATLMTMDFEVAEIELTISFSADGKFLGFGVGGATSIKVKIKPIEAKAEGDA
jgi:hypothetical protein